MTSLGTGCVLLDEESSLKLVLVSRSMARIDLKDGLRSRIKLIVDGCFLSVRLAEDKSFN